ncbi:MAG: HAD family hydrolase [Congregibacter sp.]
MDLQVITFDLDNTLWDVEPALLRAEAAQNRWLAEHRPECAARLNHGELWELKKTVWRENPELAHHVSALRKRYLKELQLRAGYGEQESEVGAEEAFALFLHERQRVELYDQALAVLEVLARDYQLGALTNGNADVYKTDAGEYFDFAFLAEEVGASKPAPDMFEAAIRVSGAKPEQILHVGDNPEHDVMGALNLGINAVWINPEGSEWRETRPPLATIATVAELPALLSELRSRA